MSCCFFGSFSHGVSRSRPKARESVSTRSAVHPLAARDARGPHLDRAVFDRPRLVWDDQVGVHLRAGAEAAALGAHAQRVVERERRRRQLGEREAAVVARVELAHRAIGGLRRGLVGDDQHALALAQRLLDRVGEPRAEIRLEHQAVDDDLDVVLRLLVHSRLTQCVGTS